MSQRPPPPNNPSPPKGTRPRQPPPVRGVLPSPPPGRSQQTPPVRAQPPGPRGAPPSGVTPRQPPPMSQGRTIPRPRQPQPESPVRPPSLPHAQGLRPAQGVMPPVPGSSRQGNGGGRAIFRVEQPPPQPPTSSQPGSSGEGAHGTLPSGSQVSSEGRSGRGIMLTEESKMRRAGILDTRGNLVSKRGLSGNKVNLLTNYFRLKQSPNWKLFNFRVDFSPVEELTKVKKALVRQLETQLGKYIFDGSCLLSTNKLCSPENPLELTTTNEQGQMVRIKFRLVGECKPTDMQYFQFFNIVQRRCMEFLEMDKLGRNYFDSKAKIQNDALKKLCLEIWPGYVTSVRQHENAALMCCELANKILRTDTVLDQLRGIVKSSGSNLQNAAKKVLLGCIVITKYNNKTYRIDDIDFNSSPCDKFEKNGQLISYIDYYRQKYPNCQISDKKQPLLISMPKDVDRRRGDDKPVKLIPELCNMTGLSEEQRANFSIMREIAVFTRTAPPQRVAALRKFSTRMLNENKIQEHLKDWGMEFANQLEQIEGRSLPPETILPGEGASQFKYKVDNADWGACFRNWKMFGAVPCMKWICLYCSKEEDLAKRFTSDLLSVSAPMGFRLANPKFHPIPDTRTPTYANELQKVVIQGAQMIMIMIPKNTGDAYHAIKKICCVDYAIPSQVVTSAVLRKQLSGKSASMKSVATKVAIQIATKLGGQPWAVNIPLKGTMIVGYDTYHDSLNKNMSVGAVVSTINPSFTRFSSSCTFQKPGHEHLSEMKVCFGKALRSYQKHNGQFPSRIIIYRDGVGDGQIEYVKEGEVRDMKQVMKELGVKAKFTFIIVSKRINTRFFQTNGREPMNPPSGTVVDDVVTLPERFDFFLISQSVRQGTVNPTSYNIIDRTDDDLSPDKLQMLTYKMTHLYFNWPGTVRVPAVCQYAHKLAFLVGQSLHNRPREDLEDLLYYL